MNGRIRVLVVDDSAFARKVLREVLSATPDIEVVGTARDGLEALEKIEQLKPDVITLDLVMPGLDGLGLLQALPREDCPRVVVVSMTGAASELALAALELGAVELVQKPTALATDRLYELGGELAQKVRAAARARLVPVLLPGAPLPAARGAGAHSIVVVGASTGGPQALTQLLTRLPADFPVPMAVALHIPAGYTETLAARLNEQSLITVQEAASGMPLRPGLAIVAKGGFHLEFARGDDSVHASLRAEASQRLHVPSVDLMFQSAADTFGARVLGVVLTGMGDDGTQGAAAIRRVGGKVLTQSEESCVIYGMPRSVVEAGSSDGSAPIHEMAVAIMRSL